MSGEEPRLLRWTELSSTVGPEKKCQEDEERTRREVERQKTVEARRLLPPLGPVVWTATKKGEVEGHRQKLASTGDMILRYLEKDFQEEGRGLGG